MKWIVRLVVLLASIALIIPFVVLVMDAANDYEDSFLYRIIND